jgi:hypothetical protein
MFLMRQEGHFTAVEILNLKHCVIQDYFEKRFCFALLRTSTGEASIFECEDSTVKSSWCEFLVRNMYLAWTRQQHLLNPLKETQSIDFYDWHKHTLKENEKKIEKALSQKLDKNAAVELAHPKK